jgi:thiamine biosynthesis lipoprotein
MLEWHAQFSRFDPSSELSRLNRDPRPSVPVSAMMVRFVEAALSAAALTDGLVDPTLVDEIESAGYVADSPPPSVALTPDVACGPAHPHPDARWRAVTVDRREGTVTRPVGLRLDSGGVAKGLFGDVLAAPLRWHDSFAVSASGDLRLGGAGRRTRAVQVISPLEEGVVHTFELVAGAVATSGITRRMWRGDHGEPAHHLLDPATGCPAFTGVIQATALAPTGVEAEARVKAALLSGPDAAPGWLAHGGVVVYDDGSHDVVQPSDEDLR